MVREFTNPWYNQRSATPSETLTTVKIKKELSVPVLALISKLAKEKWRGWEYQGDLVEKEPATRRMHQRRIQREAGHGAVVNLLKLMRLNIANQTHGDKINNGPVPWDPCAVGANPHFHDSGQRNDGVSHWSLILPRTWTKSIWTSVMITNKQSKQWRLKYSSVDRSDKTKSTTKLSRQMRIPNHRNPNQITHRNQAKALGIKKNAEITKPHKT